MPSRTSTGMLHKSYMKVSFKVNLLLTSAVRFLNHSLNLRLMPPHAFLSSSISARAAFPSLSLAFFHMSALIFLSSFEVMSTGDRVYEVRDAVDEVRDDSVDEDLGIV